MAVPGAEEDVYLTLLLNDTYLPGALVLAHSLRDGGTTKKLGVMVILDSTIYDYVIPVPRIRNEFPANLSLMNRSDLQSAFTKINLWKQTSFRKIVYIDADVVAYRAPDELFDIAQPFSATPDIGWPDIFNTGVMVLTPNMGDYYALMAMAERGISFDGADQGLLNMHFKNACNRLSFTYNVTPSGHYQYIPAYRHFQSSISMVHFIGPNKPWFQGRYASTGNSPYDEMVGRWWAVYDRHYRVMSPSITPSKPGRELVQYLTKGEYQPRRPQTIQVQHTNTTGEPYSEHRHDRSLHFEQLPSFHFHHKQPEQYAAEHHDNDPYHHQQQHHVESQPGGPVQQSGPEFPSASLSSTIKGTQAEARKEQEQHHRAQPPPPEQKKPESRPVTFSDWDAQRHAPPTGAKPEAANLPATVYEMSQDPTPFVPPVRYPSPPKDMWFEVPKERPTEKPKSIFPWETHRPRPSRVFADDSSRAGLNIETPSTATGEPWANAPSETQPSAESSVIEPVTPTTPAVHVTSSDPWTSFTRTNAWDEVPEIERYVGAMQKHRRSKSLKSPGSIGMPSPGGAVNESEWRQHGTKLTDFPSEAERPSLPVTPAPIRRPKFWGGGGPGIGDDGDEDPLLPHAEGVPRQTEWDPVAQLQKLAKQQSEVLLQKLGGGARDSSDLPPRPLPYGSEELTSPTYVAQSAKVLSPQPRRNSTSSGLMRGILSGDESTPQSTTTADTAKSTTIAEPSYTGPGATFEKGEGYMQQETPLPPSEEQRDVLDS
ncbi:family 8 glycosyl transferase [Pseudomassariella vexata]|uniref:glycogenin glucosyltransferase n=1 Tax=Pseudomassariella vexata TaxID=1141098 RepID=A0A1Y2ELN5_9PEZI|nr:family 8 glycosyl transferase [Pseudomassariella vexata]ORY71765.1 family 8 glycosyl transferase [Pseudomassariella vexata]